MRAPTPILPGRTGDPAPLRVAPPPPEAAVRAMSETDLLELRRALRIALSELELGSRPSALVGRLSRLARSELRRRQSGGAPEPPRLAA